MVRSKSKLRKPHEVALGPQYAGARISREEMLDAVNDEASDSEEDEEEEGSEGADFADPDKFDGDFDAERVDEEADIDSDEALGESDNEKFKDFTFRGSGKPKTKAAKAIAQRPKAADFMTSSDDGDASDMQGAMLDDLSEGDETDEDVLDVDDQHAGSQANESSVAGDQDSEVESENPDQSGAESESNDEGSEDESENDDDEDEEERRAELRKIMGEEQNSVVATISQAAKADAEKGNAVKQQRKAFDSLLNVRIRLQKGLVATNSMAAVEEKDSSDSEESPYQAAEEAAIKLWNTLNGIRHQLSKANNISTAGQKRKRGVETSTTSSEIWEQMQGTELANIDLRQSCLEKWSAKVKGSAALPLSRKLNPNAPQQSITAVLQDQLASSHLISRTKIPRSCAPLQVKQKLTTDPDIYDDADFYQMLLKELLDQRMVDSASAPVVGENGRPMQWTAVKEAKTRKSVDTKASKGRKMRFTIHEKLQNFMAPEDRTSWEQLAVDRFFGTLLGQKMSLGENEDGASDEEDEVMGDDGFKLFG